jgi:DNA-binding response OmpR family regulator
VKVATTSDMKYQYSNSRRYAFMLLDDEEDVTAVLKKGLESRADFTVDAFNDPEEALKSISIKDYDLLIVDIRLPKMDGFEFYQKAKELKDWKVIFITASDSYHEEYQNRFPEWNGNCFVLKPISVSVLSNFLVQELSGTRAEREPFN